MTSILKIDTADYPQLSGQEVGRELELEVRAVVTNVEAELLDTSGFAKKSVSAGTIHVELLILDLDITQTT